MPRGHALSAIVGRSHGGEVSALLSWQPRLRHSAEDERANWRLIGVGVHWLNLDEDIGVEGLVLGKRWREGGASLARPLIFG
jgi:hypothetical protein